MQLIISLFCQPVIIGSNYMPTIWLEVKKKTLFSAKQLNCNTVQLWCSHGARQAWSQASLLDSSALFLTGLLSALVYSVLWSAPFWDSLLWPALVCSASWHQPGRQDGKGKCTPRARRQMAYTNRSLCPWFLFDLSLCIWGFQILAIWLVRIELLWLVRALHL